MQLWWVLFSDVTMSHRLSFGPRTRDGRKIDRTSSSSPGSAVPVGSFVWRISAVRSVFGGAEKGCHVVENQRD